MAALNLVISPPPPHPVPCLLGLEDVNNLLKSDEFDENFQHKLFFGIKFKSKLIEWTSK